MRLWSKKSRQSLHPPKPTVTDTLWITKAKSKWGEDWGNIVPITIATKEDYLDSHRNKYFHVMGEHPGEDTPITKLPKCVPAE
eukprot:10275692-Karenia_brevis.AAC.1